MKGRRFLVPEVVQTSAMDCGPAALASLLAGFGIPASYGRLREACQIDVDGTSIDTLEEVAGRLGLAAEQVMIPPDHLLLPEAAALPALVVVHLPDGATHFVIVWRVHGPLVQVMDPATGRRWLTRRQLLEQLFVHRMPVPAAAWREWAGTESFLGPLQARLEALGVGRQAAGGLLAAATADPGWAGLAALDAAARLLAALVRAGGVGRGTAAERLLASLFGQARQAPGAPGGAVPEAYWSVTPVAQNAGEDETVRLRGAVLVRAGGRRPAAPAGEDEQLPPELAAALAEPPPRPGRDLWRQVKAESAAAPAALLVTVAAAALGVTAEALLFRGFLELGDRLDLTSTRLFALALLAAFAAALLLLELPIARGTLRLGRHLETRLRLAFLHKVPRLPDRYFQSRLASDMAERSHSAHRLRQVPGLAESAVRTGAELLFTFLGLLWLDPGLAPWVLAAGVLVVGVPVGMLPFLADWDLRLRNHLGALSRYYLDALLGLVPLRTHGAERAIRRQHEDLLTLWTRAHLDLRRAEVIADTVVQVSMLGVIAGLVFDHVRRAGLDGSVLLIFYWGYNVFTLGHMLTLMIATQAPSYRNLALRLAEPLGAPEEPAGPADAAPPARVGGAGVALRFEGVAVRAGGHRILEGIDLAVAPGEQVAILGPSGAGKSSLVGLLLGWHRPAEGRLTVDGRALAAEGLVALRRATAWVDPAVQLWNRSLYDNLLYGNADPRMRPGQAVEAAELHGVLQKLPQGFRTPLGEGGGLVSGGEGQRVRFARSLLRAGARLVVLDEPFRGLDREQRRLLLARARALWPGATFLCITHDVGETLAFPRALVLEGGQVVEDGPPAELAERPGSRYAALLAAERQVRQELWEGGAWRRLRLANGRLSERGRDS